MKALVLNELSSLAKNPRPLQLVEQPRPLPGRGEVLLQVLACGVCHTELDEIEGRTPPPLLPVILGHQVVGRVEELGEGATALCIGDRVGVGWFYSSCGVCPQCLGVLDGLVAGESGIVDCLACGAAWKSSDLPQPTPQAAAEHGDRPASAAPVYE